MVYNYLQYTRLMTNDSENFYNNIINYINELSKLSCYEKL